MDYTLPTPVIVLHIYPGQWDLPSFDPICTAALLYLQLAIPGQFSLKACSDPDSSPTGQLPFLVHEQQVVNSFSAIVRYVSGLHHASYVNSDLDSHLSASEKSQRNAWFAHVESHLADLVYHNLYVNHENWTKLIHPTLASMLPVPQKYYVPQRIRNMYYPRLLSAGLWRDHVEEKSMEKASLREKFQAKKEDLGKHPAMSRAFEKEKVLEKARADLEIYKELLGDKTYIFHEKLSSLDILIAAHISLLLNPPLPDPLLKDLITTSYPSLASHSQRIYDLAFQSVKATPVATPKPPSLWSLIPSWPKRQSVRKPVGKEDVYYDRMTWGFIGLALGSLAAYLFVVGRNTQIKFVLVEDEVVEEEV
ncbi:Tom37 C-terminal domain-containing protein [Gymnopilus junonius]|uniref:Tom37 C-terminal domain-containing protein n=1 Tax=Gymnopilus junonius TaxID=109634 RepID=A0A9P5P0V3_GYMJU|nr:Tom37 C-terminal domain-containing protein [Gymnopilus junonius]